MARGHGPGGPGGRFLTEEEKKNQPKVTKALLVRVFSYLKPYRAQLALVLLCIIVSSAFSLAPSILSGRILDEGLIGRSLRALIFYIVLSLAVNFAAHLIGVAESYINTWIAQHITYDMRNAMFLHLQKMSHRFFTGSNQGDIITRMTSDIDGVQRVITGTFTSILSNCITLIIALIAMYRKNWILATIGVVIVPLFTLPTRRAGKTRWDLTRQAQECNDEINGILNETMSVSGQLLVKLFGKEAYEYDRYRRANERMIRLNIRESMAGRWFFVVLRTFTEIGPMLIYLVGGILMMRYDANLTVGDITVMVALLSRLYMPVNNLLNIQVDWVRAMALFTRIFEYYDMPVEIDNAPDAVTPQEKATGEVVFDHVWFSYTPREAETRYTLKDVSFTLKAGDCIAIVGPSGSGKSTTVNLIPRLYDVNEGNVTFDGIDVRKLDLNWLRAQIGVVSQETYLFNGSIRDNLLYAKPDATEAEMIEACRKANIYDFIEAQETGLDTLVGNRGLKLSGGEKQRISIARVLLKDPALFIFDEATSALDSISETKIQEAIDPIINSRTSILIAHRLSTILSADEILVVRDGEVVERGTHDALVHAGGTYTELYETQFKAQVPASDHA
ncbi:MAG: ABC transporter ATP-binding protein [Lachnospiraceae bacterium]|nr:ABC transporter ATP-binding protein [Lachnospiraceae bacterium]